MRVDPEHWLADPQIAKAVRPCLALWAAVMQVAIEDSRGLGPMPSGHRDGSRADLRDRAVAWLSSPEQKVGSFLWICSLLDLDPGAVRAALTRKVRATPP